MMAKLIHHQIGVDIEQILNSALIKLNIDQNSPDLLIFEAKDKVTSAEINQIKHFLSLKAHKSKFKVVVIKEASSLSDLIQNSLLKTIEELNDQSLILMTTAAIDQFLPTFLSRITIESIPPSENDPKDVNPLIKEILESDLNKRFQLVEKTTDKVNLLNQLTSYFTKNLASGSANVFFCRKLLEANSWQRSHLNQRAILEYLMLELD